MPSNTICTKVGGPHSTNWKPSNLQPKIQQKTFEESAVTSQPDAHKRNVPIASPSSGRCTHMTSALLGNCRTNAISSMECRRTPNFYLSADFTRVLNLTAELARVNVQERITELKTREATHPEMIYQQRTRTIVETLNKMSPGKCGSGIQAKHDNVRQTVVTHDSDIAKFLNEHWPAVFSRKTAHSDIRIQ